jgi:hypothetical protein
LSAKALNQSTSTNELIVMKTRYISLFVSALISLPMIAHAQQSSVTREQVRQELVRLERAGYRPRANDIHYPQDIQDAEAKVAATSSVGGVTSGQSESGKFQRPGANSDMSFYAHH